MVTYICNNKKNLKKNEMHVLDKIREPQELVYHFDILTTAACVDTANVHVGPPSPIQLLRPLENQCVSMNAGWWTYRFCFLREIVQFHNEQVPDDKTKQDKEVTTQEYQMGKLDKTLDINHTGKLHKGATTQDTYLSQEYTGGTVCDIGIKQ